MEQSSTPDNSLQVPPTPEQQAAALVAQDAKAAELINGYLTTIKQQAAGYLHHHLEKIHGILKYQAAELLIFRTLETLIRTQNINEETLAGILDELKSLRVKAVGEAQAAQQAAANAAQQAPAPTE